MIHGQVRAYADTIPDLVAVLVDDPDYPRWDEVTAYKARLRVAYTAEAAHQSMVLAEEHSTTFELTPEQRRILCTPRHEPPVVDRWDGPIPLVLTMDRHEPYGDAPRPIHDPGQVIWLDATTNTALLGSLHKVGIIVVADRTGTDQVAS